MASDHVVRDIDQTFIKRNYQNPGDARKNKNEFEKIYP
jgi:hypothetical protein